MTDKRQASVFLVSSAKEKKIRNIELYLRSQQLDFFIWTILMTSLHTAMCKTQLMRKASVFGFKAIIRRKSFSYSRVEGSERT